jgi:NOL1/NOP2/fmu family ribosome biogenesis protein
MHEQLDIWTSKKVRDFLGRVKEQWGADWKPEEAFVASPKGKIFLVTRQLGALDWQRLRISSVGCYIAELRDERDAGGNLVKGRIRLSIEGSQRIGPLATKNVVDLEGDEAMLWLKGDDMELGARAQALTGGFAIVRCGKDFIGSGPLKETLLLNHVPKARRLPRNA